MEQPSDPCHQLLCHHRMVCDTCIMQRCRWRQEMLKQYLQPNGHWVSSQPSLPQQQEPDPSPNGYESGCAGEPKGPEWETMPKHRTCWISTSFSNYPRMCSLGGTLRIKDPLIKGNSLSPIPFAIACNYCKYWFGIREFSLSPRQF